MKKQLLPIGIQTFTEIRNKDFLYVDKTEVIHQLTNAGKYFFLSRPRRFGKSLLISTIKELYEGNKTLFEGLWIENKWDWEKTNPVIHLSFNALDYQGKGIEQALIQTLKNQAEQYKISLVENSIKGCFQELLQKLAKINQVVILIDEYDKPIIDFLMPKDRPQAFEHQRILKTFYSVIKDSDPFIKFLLITGVSKFSKVGVFSDLNNLRDISLSQHFSAICGYTETELHHYFEHYLPPENKQELWQKIKLWYNGYTWDFKNYMYNPFSILSYFAEGEFRTFWFETGTPTFLINLLKDRFYYDFSDAKVGNAAFLSYDIEKLDTLPLLFQTGYLTFKKKLGRIYLLGYPNKEVKESMLEHLIGAFRHGDTSRSGVIVYEVEEAFKVNDLDTVILHINSLFASIPYQLFEANKENYYHSLIHLLFKYIGIYMESEVNTSRGRVDTVVQTDNHVYIFEFKLDQSVEAAIQQIRDRGYADRYRQSGKQIVGVGVNFDSGKKEIGEWRKVEL